MVSNEYKDALIKAVSELEGCTQKRDILNAQIAGLRETVRVLSTRIPLTKDEREAISRLLDMVDYATPSLADSIRAVLTKALPNRMTAIEVRNRLEDSGFNFDDFSNSLSACHAALKRMLNDGEVDAVQTKDGKTAYRRILQTIGTIDTGNLGAWISLADSIQTRSETPSKTRPENTGGLPGKAKK